MTVAEVLRWFGRRGSKKNVAGMARYAIRTERVFGVSMATMKPLAALLRGNHALALALWRTGWYEARILAALIDDPERVTRAQMDRWAADFDNWAICDTACLHLFDRSPLAWGRIRVWARSRHEFVRRAAFALIAGLALHDRVTPDARFMALLPLIERTASDDRNFVKKAVSWALRGVGSRSHPLHRAASTVAHRLAGSASPAARWVGTDALADLSRPIIQTRLVSRTRRRAARPSA